MSDWLDIFVLGVFDAFGPYALVSLALSFLFFVFLRKNTGFRRIFIWSFTLSFLLFSFVFFWAGALRLLEGPGIVLIPGIMNWLVCLGLIFYSVLLMLKWCGWYGIGPRREFVLPALPSDGYPAALASLTAVVLAMLWGLTAALWPPSYQVSALALNIVLSPEQAPRVFFALFVYYLFRCFLLIALPFVGEALLVIARSPQGLGAYRSLLWAVSAAFLGAAGVGLFFLL